MLFADRVQVLDLSLSVVFTSPLLELKDPKYLFNLASKESRKTLSKDTIEIGLADSQGNHQILHIQFSVDLKNNTKGGFLERRLEVKNSSLTSLKSLTQPVNSGAVSSMAISSYYGGSIKFQVGDTAGNIHVYDGSSLKKSSKVSEFAITNLLTAPGGIVYFASIILI